MHSQERFSVFFESNKFELNALQTQNLKEWIVNNTNSKIVAIDGFTDEDGSNGFNDTLAKRRVDFI
jgi:outer membrane protein OmpA-like peptidoglycan-associated protein